jgi:hypothetical protein
MFRTVIIWDSAAKSVTTDATDATDATVTNTTSKVFPFIWI